MLMQQIPGKDEVSLTASHGDLVTRRQRTRLPVQQTLEVLVPSLGWQSTLAQPSSIHLENPMDSP